MKKEEDIGVMQPQAEERHASPASTRSRSGARSKFSPRVFEGVSPAHTRILAPRTVKEHIVGILSHQVRCDRSQQPKETEGVSIRKRTKLLENYKILEIIWEVMKKIPSKDFKRVP